MNRKYTVEQYLEKSRCSSATIRSGRSRPTSSSAFRAKPKRLRATLALCATGSVRAGLHVRLLAAARNAGGALGTGRAGRVQRERFARLVALSVDANVRRYHDRKLGTTVRALIHGVSRKDPDAAGGQDDRQRHRPFPADRRRCRISREPWVDVRVDRAARVGRFSGLRSAARARGDAPARPLAVARSSISSAYR
jgi:hypothetical protein